MQTKNFIREARYDRFGSTNPGNEPPLSLDGDEAPNRRRVSIRWLTGTILTGLFGATLMGGAVYAALDGEYSFARAPTTAAGTGRDATEADSQSNATIKTDRIVLQAVTDDPRQIIMIPMTNTLPGGKEEIRARPFARVLVSLALTPSDLASSVPAYNPQKLAADPSDAPSSDTPTPDQPPPAPIDEGQVTMTTRPITEVPIAVDSGMTLSLDQVRGLARELAFEASAKPLDLPSIIPQLGGIGADSGPDAPTAFADPKSALKITIVEENVTEIPKSAATTRSHEQRLIVQEKQTLEDILGKLGATPPEVTAIAKALGDASELHEGQRLRILVENVAEEGDRQRPVRLTINNADQHVATVALSDTGDYVAIGDPDQAGDTVAQDDNGDNGDDGGTGQRLYYSIYETALKQQVPKEMIEKLMRIYAYDVDLTRRTRPGDSFELFYQQDEGGKPAGDVLYTALTIGGELKRYYRFASLDDGEVDYYDEQGKSARKFLMRKPINGGEMRSPFGMRRHPILGYYKMHTGTDWAAPVGTPILATGNGTIIKAAWSNGYGRHTEIQHANGYVSTYSHMLAFAKGADTGAKVVMGQVIGYLGSSGLSTGPHCHYEVKINGSFVDPMRIKLPQGKELGGPALAAFKSERERIDSMMNKAPIAQAATTTSKT